MPVRCALARFDLRDVLAAVLAEIAQFVELGVEAGADRAAVGEVQRAARRRSLRECGRATSGSSSSRSCSVRSRAACCVSKHALQRGNLLERAAQRQQIARTGRAQRDLGEQAFEIENAGQLLAQLGAQNGLLQQFADGVEALLRFRRGPGKAAAGAGAAGGRPCRLRLVEHVQQRGLRLRARRRRRAARPVPDCAR